MALGVGVATVWDGGARYACAILLWCRSAVRLAHAIGESDARPIIIGTSNASADCPHARYIWPRRTAALLLAGYKIAARSRANLINLLKVELFALTDYRLIFFTDIDVDPAPPPVGLGQRATPGWLDHWRAGVRAFVESPSLIVTSPDHNWLTNTGVMLIKPRPWLHAAALRLLSNLTFSKEAGFNRAGPLQGLLPKLDLHQIGRGACMTAEQVQAHVNATPHWRLNRWGFVAAPIDQGFFFYLCYVLYPVGTWARRSGSVDTQHWWGPYKPWRPSGLRHIANAQVRYLWRLHEAGERAC